MHGLVLNTIVILQSLSAMQLRFMSNILYKVFGYITSLQFGVWNERNEYDKNFDNNGDIETVIRVSSTLNDEWHFRITIHRGGGCPILKNGEVLILKAYFLPTYDGADVKGRKKSLFLWKNTEYFYFYFLSFSRKTAEFFSAVHT